MMFEYDDRGTYKITRQMGNWLWRAWDAEDMFVDHGRTLTKWGAKREAKRAIRRMNARRYDT